MTEDPWYLAARVGTVIPLAFVRVDRVGSTGDWKELPPEEVARTRAAYVEAVEAAARSVKAAEPFHWQGDGLMFFVTDDRGRPATVRAFDASCRLWERLRVDVRIEARIGVHAARVAWTSDTGKLAHPAIDLCGHLEHVAPPGAVAVSEDVFLALPQKDRLLMARLGTTKRDRAPAYVFPAPAMDRKDPANFTISDDLDLWDAFRAYALGTDVRLLRYVGLPLQRIAPPSLEVEGVFVPAELDVPSRRVIGPPAREHEIREEETTSRSPVLDVLRDTRALVVLGDPGSGKTTLVKWLAVIAARGRLTWEGRIGTYERLLPLPVSVGKLAEIRRPKDCVVDAMACYFRSRNVGRDENALGRFLSERLEADECLVLLDGLDEVRAAERDEVRAWLETFASRYERNRFLVASRRVGYTSFALRGGTEVFLRPFDDAQVSAYVTAFARAYRRWEMPGLIDEPAEKQAAETLLAAIREHPRIQDMARNPFLLSGLALVHRAEGRLPRHRVHVYEIFARALCETWGWARRMVPSSGKPDIAYEEEAIPVLGELAIEMHENHPTGVAPEEFVVETLAAALGRRKRVGGEEALQAARKFLERAGRDVQLLMERGAGEWGFLHLTFQEFFAAAGLHAQERFDAFALEHLFDPRWEEVIRLGVGYQVIVQGRPAAAQRLVVAALARRDAARPWVTEILRKQVPMAALLAAEAGDALPEEVRERIAGEFARWATDPSLPEQGRFLHEVGQTDFREPVARALIPLLDDRHGAVREAAARALGEMKWESALPALLGTLKDRDVAVRSAAAWALGKMQSESALPALLGALK
ncbi:MAG: HEAT repeat domain-containing protein, partial [Planctomycetes bacterium]|nr:HEAT repeat domain-containing protein [Planctomycetota bacterium]